MKFDQQLVEELITESNLDLKIYARFLKSCNNDHVKLITLLVREGYIPRRKYGRKIGDLIGFAYLPLSETLIEHHVLTQIPKELAEKLGAIALYEINGVVSVAMSQPTNTRALAELSAHLNKDVSPVFSFEDEVHNAISMNYITIEWLEEALDSVENSSIIKSGNTKEELTTLSQVKEITNLLDMIIHLALKNRASDIHLEPKKHHLLLRFRNDGILFNKSVLSLEVLAALVSRIKVLCQMDITEKRKPQDGRFEFKLKHNSIDVRVSVLPSLHGEKVVMRLLGADLFDKYLDFETLGFSDEVQQKVKRALDSPNGMLFVSGPTGSGKTTTLHCALNHINHSGINVMTIEDPIEYERPNITQVSINPKFGRDFPTVLRSMLRQDPDVIMIGEIRDLETAKIAANAALTGHMVLTSLHTNNSIQAVTRMVEMGVEHFVIAPSIIGVLGQRLVRKICPRCKISYQPSIKELAKYFDLSKNDKLPLLYKGSGCEHCNHTGFSGRIAIHEYLGITQDLRNCILRGSNYDEFYKMAMECEEYIQFQYDGFKKALMGLTTLQEVDNAVSSTIGY